MEEVRLIEVKEEILADNNKVASGVREKLRNSKTMLLNLMSSPGSGKTSLILRTLEGLKNNLRLGVIEADIDSTVDTGAHKNVMILSVPEGDDKPLKYPLMFSICDVLLVNKIDYLSLSDFDMDALKKRVLALNKNIRILPVSCKTGEGIDAWVSWLKEAAAAYIT